MELNGVDTLVIGPLSFATRVPFVPLPLQGLWAEAKGSCRRGVSLRLQETTGEVWPEEVLEKHLWAVRESSRTFGFQLKETWGSNDAFLTDVSQNAGIVAPHDGPREPWRYLYLRGDGPDKLIS